MAASFVSENMGTFISWSVVLAVFGALLFKEYPEQIKGYLGIRPNARAPTPAVPSDTKKTSKAKPKSIAKQKPAKAQAKAPQPEAPAPDHTTNGGIVEEEGESAEDFARALRKAQKGTNLKSSEKASEKPAKKKGKKKGKNEQSNGTNGHAASTEPAPASVTNSEASEPSQPSLLSGAAGMATDIGTKVVDTLRIYEDAVHDALPREDEWTSVPTKTQRTKEQAVRKEETKKQRQRAAEKERQKEAIEQAERERRKLEEAQRRTARLARGEPARNGESYQAASAPKASVWASKQQESHANSAMLDTLDASNASSSTPPEARTPVIISSDDGYEEVNGTDLKTETLLNGSG